MKIMYLQLLVLILTSYLLPQTTSRTKELTLDQALSIAFERNPDVATASNEIERARAEVLSAYGSYLPRLNVSTSYNRAGYDSPPTIRYIGGIPFDLPRTQTWNSTYSGTVGLSYTLFDGFSRETRFSTAQTGHLQAEQTSERTRQSIANAVQISYLTLLLNERQVEVRRQNVNDERKRLERIQEQNRLGVVAIGDVYRQQSTVAQSEYNLITAQNTYDKSKADLLNLLGLDASSDFIFADPSIDSQIKQVETDPDVKAMGSFEYLRKRALEARLDYANAKENVALADFAITQAWSGYYPSLIANGSYSTNAQSWDVATSSGNRSFNVGLTLSWQFPEIFGSVQGIQTARISKTNAELQLDKKERDITVELKKALLDLESARKQYEASKKARVAAEQDKKIAEEKYNLGGGTLLDLQVATTAFLDAQVTTLNNAYNYFALKKKVELVIGEKRY